MATLTEDKMVYEVVLDGTDDEAVNLQEVFRKIEQAVDKADSRGRRIRLILTEE